VAAEQVRFPTCAGCPHEGQPIVSGEGSLDSEWLVVAEAPGPDEEAEGRPLIGPSGYIFHSSGLLPAKLPREALRIENAKQCKGPAGSAKGRIALRHCGPSLQDVIQRMPRLKFIVALGEPALVWISGRAQSAIARGEYNAAAKKHTGRLEAHERKLAKYEARLEDYRAKLASSGKRAKPPKEPGAPPALDSGGPPSLAGYEGITDWRGSFLPLDIGDRHFTIYPVLHPASVMAFRQPRLRPLLTLDFIKLAKHARGDLAPVAYQTTTVATAAELADWFERFPTGPIGIDIETSRRRHSLECFCVGGGDDYALVPWRDITADERQRIARVLQGEFDSPARRWEGHNVSGFDESKLGEFGFRLCCDSDSLYGFHIAFAEFGSPRDEQSEDDESKSQASGYHLGFVQSVLVPMPYHKGVVGKERDASEVANEELYPYCVKDVAAAWHAMRAIEREFRVRYPETQGERGCELMRADMRRARIARRMGQEGVPILESERVAKLQEWTAKAEGLEARVIDLVGDPNFNPHSNPQKAAALVRSGIRLTRMTDTGRQYKLDAKVIEGLLAKHPSSELLQCFSELSGIRDKEIAVYEKHAPRDDGTVEVSWKPHGTVGARWSSSPNEQNLTEEQKRMIGREGWLVLVPDLSAAELWVIAKLSGQTDLLRDLENNRSPHYATCHELFGRDIDKRANPDEYGFGKSTNYRWCYTLPDEALQVEGGQLRTASVDVDLRRLARVTAWLNRRWGAIVAWKRRTIRHAESTGFSYSPSGRFRDLRWAVKSHAKQLKHHAARAALNFPIQCEIGELIGDALERIVVRLDALNQRENKICARCFANEHDSLPTIVRPEYADEVATILRECMSAPWQPLGGLRIPVEVKRGPSWGEAR
jgi:uracil-DNA glycosylase family 4